MSPSALMLPIQECLIGTQTKPTVNARLLHVYLEVGRQFSHWIQERIKDYEFILDSDYTVDKNGYGNYQQLRSIEGTFEPIEYHLTFDMAKELCMIERTLKGREARKYFIACEAALRDVLSDASQIKTYLLPGYEPWTKQFPDAYWAEVSRVYGFPPPQGVYHSPGCRGVTYKYIHGALPRVVQEALLQNNPYQPDGRTRRQRHHQWFTPERKEDFLHQRITQVMTVLRATDDRNKDMFKDLLHRHDRRHGIEIQVSPLLRCHLAMLNENQLWLFEPPA